MKYLIMLLAFMSSFAHGQDLTFKENVYPLLKSSPIHLILFTHLDFHPTYVIEYEDEKSHTISTLVSYSPDEKGSITWTHLVIFNLKKNKDNEVVISSIDFRETAPHQPCFVPREVVSVDGLGNMTSYKVSMNSQPLLPKVKQTLQNFNSETK